MEKEKSGKRFNERVRKSNAGERGNGRTQGRRRNGDGMNAGL